LTPSNSNLP